MAIDVLPVLLAKIEAIYGADAVPTAAVLLVDPKFTPLESDKAERKLVRGYMGSPDSIPHGFRCKLEFSVELASSGAKGTPPAFDALLRACGFAANKTDGVKVAYTPVSKSFESATLYYNIGGILYKLLGARGKCSLDMSNKAVPKLKFDFIGLQGGRADAEPGAAEFTAWKEPLVFEKANVPVCTLHGYGVAVESLSLDMGQKVEYQSRPGGAEVVRITDRNPSGSIKIESTKVAEKDWLPLIKAATAGALQVQLGSAEGSIVEVSANVVLGGYDYDESNGIYLSTLPLTPKPVHGNDELTLTFR